MSDLSKKLKNSAIAVAIGGGSLVLGSQAGKPACDYVFINEQKEICLTTEQAEFITDNLKGRNTGFGRSQFEEIKIIPK